jgi:hypothetical protein
MVDNGRKFIKNFIVQLIIVQIYFDFAVFTNSYSPFPTCLYT